MNPGSSKPKNIDETSDNSFLNKFVPAFPDPTQSQIMKVMDNCNLEYAKIINLSDLRDSVSNSFYNRLKTDLIGKNHSIFSTDEYLKGYLNPNSIFLFAWGVNKQLQKLSINATDKIHYLFGNNIKKIGLKHLKNVKGYYHPLPRKIKDQEKWVTEITKQIKDSQYLTTI